MSLSAPKQITFWIAVIIWIVALIGAWVTAVTDIVIVEQGLHFWLALLAGLILAVGNVFEGV